MNTNSNNLEPEFDALLKAHIKTYATTECAGFDFETASAYLEHTLQAKASTLYEAHLADCAACRNQIVELSRLMPAETVVASAVVPGRTKWSEWFSGWKLGMLAGLGTATAAILLFTMVTIQRENAPQTVAQSKEVTAPSMAVPLADDSFTELKETAKQDAAKTVNPAPSASVMAAVPAQSVAAKTTAPAMDAAKKSIQLDGASKTENLAKASPAPAVIAPSAVPAESKDAALQNLPQGQLQNSQWLPRALPTPTPHGPSFSQNQMQNVQVVPAEAVARSAGVPAPASIAKREERQAEKAQERAKQKVDDAEKSERGRLSDKFAAAASAAKPAPGKNVAGKNFRFENGRWIDTQLSAGTPEIRLKRNSDEYKKILKDTPGLKPYFDLKAVTVVWEGKAYRVE